MIDVLYYNVVAPVLCSNVMARLWNHEIENQSKNEFMCLRRYASKCLCEKMMVFLSGNSTTGNNSAAPNSKLLDQIGLWKKMFTKLNILS